MNTAMRGLVLVTMLSSCVVATEPTVGEPGETGPPGPPGGDGPKGDVGPAGVSPFTFVPNTLDIYYADGSVGVGTAKPNILGSSSNFRVLTLVGPTGAQLELANVANQPAPNSEFGNITFVNGTIESARIFANTTASDAAALVFMTKATGSPVAERLRIAPDGRVGIGVPEPDAGLHVANGGTLLMGENLAYDSSTLVVRNHNPTHGAGSPILEIEQELSPGPYLFLLARTTNGGSGVDPINKFYVDQDGNAFFDGCVTASNVDTPCGSDVRLKHNIAPLVGSLDRLLQLRGVTYEWKEPNERDKREGRQIGMIAQEVEQVFPDWVGTDAQGKKTLAYRGFEALAVESLRELKLENSALKVKNQDLSARVTSLEQRLSRLESLLAKDDRGKQ